MSSTGRGGVRRALDFYETPAWCVHRLLDRVFLPDGRWLDPCCGNGAIGKAIESYPRKGIQVTGNDIDPQMPAACHEDFTSTNLGEWDGVITNPPYGHAEAIARNALDHAPVVVLLLRLAWLASAKRHSFLREHRPDVYVLPNRPSFTGGGTDSTDYAWFIWAPVTWHLGERGRLDILDLTPRGERRV